MLVTENPRGYSDFIGVLKSKYSVDDMGYIITARHKLSKKPKEYILIITEVRMSPIIGTFSLKETQDGAITGIFWFEKELNQLGIPVLFWSCDKENEKLIDELKIKYPNKIGFIYRDSFIEDHLLKGVEEFLKN